MMEWINDWGKIAGSIGAIISVLTAALWKPLASLRRRKKAGIAAEKQESKEFQSTMLTKLDSISGELSSIAEDVGDLQCDRLNQAHDYYMEKGYCPTERKQVLCNMYKSYHGKGRNHLSNHYEEDIMELPDRPKGEDRI